MLGTPRWHWERWWFPMGSCGERGWESADSEMLWYQGQSTYHKSYQAIHWWMLFPPDIQEHGNLQPRWDSETRKQGYHRSLQGLHRTLQKKCVAPYSSNVQPHGISCESHSNVPHNMSDRIFPACKPQPRVNSKWRWHAHQLLAQSQCSTCTHPQPLWKQGRKKHEVSGLNAIPCHIIFKWLHSRFFSIVLEKDCQTYKSPDMSRIPNSDVSSLALDQDHHTNGACPQ